MQNTYEKEYVERLKKAYSILSQAVNLSMSRTGLYPDEWGATSSSMMPLINKILPYINYIKVCEAGEICHKDNIKTKSKKDRGNIYGDRPAVILSDGIIIGAFVGYPLDIKISGVTKKLLGEYEIDINGNKGPNVVGTDIFYVLLTNDGIMPTGSQDLENTNWSWPFDFENGCLASNANGAGCTAWVLQNSNLDYLHCPDKIKAGNSSCKEK